jgi:hypothetical protein
MVPKTLEEWSISEITSLLSNGYRELETFDWKEKLPHSKDEDGKRRLIKACCSFANGDGGFLVFGVNDKSDKPVHDRLTGIPRDQEFFEHFGNFPAKCEPSIYWIPKNPPIDLNNGNVIHIVQIPKSWNGPHCCKDSANGLIFPKRTNKGDEDMGYSEIRSHFLGYYEKRLKIQLILVEIENIIAVAKSLLMTEDNIATHYGLQEFSLTILESTLVDTYTILYSNHELVSLLFRIRDACRVLNAKVTIFRSAMGLGLRDDDSILPHNRSIQSNCQLIVQLSEQAHNMLQKFLSL